MKFLPKRSRPEPTGRRRPLPGTERQDKNRAYSYYSSRMPGEAGAGRLSAREALEHRKRRNWRRVMSQTPLVLAMLVVAVCAISEFGLSAAPKIVPLASSGGELFLRPAGAYQQAAAKLFARSWENRNKLTVDTAGITKALERQFPELNSVSVALPILGHKPVVYIQPVEPTLILKTMNGSFLLDIAGRALISTNTVAPRLVSLSLPVVTDQTGLEVHTGDAVLPSSDANFIHTVAAELSAQHIRVRNYILPPAASELDVYIAGVPYHVKFNMQTGPLQQVGTFVATYHQLARQGTTPMAYIDVRIPGRVYYK